MKSAIQVLLILYACMLQNNFERFWVISSEFGTLMSYSLLKYTVREKSLNTSIPQPLKNWQIITAIIITLITKNDSVEKLKSDLQLLFFWGGGGGLAEVNSDMINVIYSQSQPHELGRVEEAKNEAWNDRD